MAVVGKGREKRGQTEGGVTPGSCWLRAAVAGVSVRLLPLPGKGGEIERDGCHQQVVTIYAGEKLRGEHHRQDEALLLPGSSLPVR